MQELSKELIEKEAIQWLKTNYPNTGWAIRGFILPDGYLTSNPPIQFDDNTSDIMLKSHGTLSIDFEWYLCEKYNVEYQIIEDVLGMDSLHKSYGHAMTLIFDYLGFIRLNGEAENYICIGDSNPTQAQYTALVNWIDNFFKYWNYKKSIGVQITNGLKVDSNKYSPKDYSGKEIVMKLKKYIAQGRQYLEETYTPKYPTPDKQYELSNEEAKWTKKALDYNWWGSESDFDKDYAKAYKVSMSPEDFLNLTTLKNPKDLKVGDDLGMSKLKELDLAEFERDKISPLYLNISFTNDPTVARVTSHEGRHRAFALMKAGIKKIDVLLSVNEYESNYDKYNPHKLSNLTLIGQYDEKPVKVVVNNPIPMSYNNHFNLSSKQESFSLIDKLLLEDNRRLLINKSKKAGEYKNKDRGKNRFERKKFSKVANSVRSYNQINMNNLFKSDLLQVEIPVTGETDSYTVSIKMDGVIAEIQKGIKNNNNKFEFKVVVQALTKVFNTSNIYVKCTCPDYKYRFDHWNIVNNVSTSDSAHDPGPGKGIVNPNDDMGRGCKHVLLVLANADWIMKVASVINNYVHYAEEHLQKPFLKLIFPKLYGISLDEAGENDLLAEEDVEEFLDSSSGLIDAINEYGRNRGKIKKGSNKNPIAQKEREKQAKTDSKQDSEEENK